MSFWFLTLITLNQQKLLFKILNSAFDIFIIYYNKRKNINFCQHAHYINQFLNSINKGVFAVFVKNCNNLVKKTKVFEKNADIQSIETK